MRVQVKTENRPSDRKIPCQAILCAVCVPSDKSIPNHYGTNPTLSVCKLFQ